MSGIVIPLGITPASVGVGAGISLGTPSSKQAVLRAVVAAVAVKDPGRSLEAAKLAREDQGKLFDEATAAKNKAITIITAVEAARQKPPDIKPSDDLVSAARVAGADAKLTAVAFAQLTDADIIKAGINWAAAVDGPLLERTAQATGKEHFLGLVPDLPKQISQLESDVATVKQSVGTLNQSLVTLTERVTALETTTGTGGTGTGTGTAGTGTGAPYTRAKGPVQNP